MSYSQQYYEPSDEKRVDEEKRLPIGLNSTPLSETGAPASPPSSVFNF
jgi:hypothetical protein